MTRDPDVSSRDATATQPWNGTRTRALLIGVGVFVAGSVGKAYLASGNLWTAVLLVAAVMAGFGAIVLAVVTVRGRGGGEPPAVEK